MTTPTDEALEPGTVVVGFDRSADPRSAVAYALGDAARRGVGLDAVTVYEPAEPWAWPHLGEPTHTGDPDTDEAAITRAARDLITEVAGGLEPPLGPRMPEVTIHLRRGRAADILVEVSRRAAVLVVSHDGRGPLTSAMLGSVGLHCVLHAACPTTVVPPAIPST